VRHRPSSYFASPVESHHFQIDAVHRIFESANDTELEVSFQFELAQGERKHIEKKLATESAGPTGDDFGVWPALGSRNESVVSTEEIMYFAAPCTL
jgi:hypothetical protein